MQLNFSFNLLYLSFEYSLFTSLKTRYTNNQLRRCSFAIKIILYANIQMQNKSKVCAHLFTPQSLVSRCYVIKEGAASLAVLQIKILVEVLKIIFGK